MRQKKQAKAEKDAKKQQEKLRLLERKRLLLGKTQSKGSSMVDKDEGIDMQQQQQNLLSEMPQFVATKRFLEEVKKAADADLVARGVHLETLQAKEVTPLDPISHIYSPF